MAELHKRGQTLTQQMENAGSIGTPSYKQIMMNKLTAQDGVQIAGYKRSINEDMTSKGRKGNIGNEDNSTQKLKEKDNSKRTESRARENPTQAHFAHEKK